MLKLVVRALHTFPLSSEGVWSDGVGSDGVGSEGYLFLDRINRIYRIEIVWEISSSLVPKCHK